MGDDHRHDDHMTTDTTLEGHGTVTSTPGIDPVSLEDVDLLRELSHLHETRHETFLHGSDDALAAHSARTEALEHEYLRRNPARQVRAERTREGARGRST